jgi:biotin carboxyl carrier protein
MSKALASLLALLLAVTIVNAQEKKENNAPKISADTIASDFKKDPSAAEKKYGGDKVLSLEAAEVLKVDFKGMYVKNSAGIDLYIKSSSRSGGGKFTVYAIVQEGKFVSFKDNVLTIEATKILFSSPLKKR